MGHARNLFERFLFLPTTQDRERMTRLTPPAQPQPPKPTPTEN